MWQFRLWLLLLLAFFLTTSLHASRTPVRHDASVKHSTFLSPPFFLRPGSVANKFFLDIPFPKGHIALKSFDAEVVDEKGVPVPLHETYLHHWVVERFHANRGTDQSDPSTWKHHVAGNDGICKGTLKQHFGLGSETRRTSTWIPGPYGIEVGNRNSIPDGYDEIWMMNVHAIDTRQVEDRLGCTECRCGLYNVTKDGYGRPLREGYIGGLSCCHDADQCRMREGFKDGEMRKLYMKYTVMWVEWSTAVVPVRIYVLDVTDTGKQTNDTGGGLEHSSCKVEYDVQPCDSADKSNGKCVDIKKARAVIPRGGDIVYGVAHQHSGGLGSNLFGQDGRMLCASMPTYGNGKEAGNEAGYIVGMTTCYPKPGSVRVGDGEVLTVESNYSSAQLHTGVMGLFYILVADPQPQSSFMDTVHSLRFQWGASAEKYWWAFLLVGVVVVAASIAGISYRRRRCITEGYQSI